MKYSNKIKSVGLTLVLGFIGLSAWAGNKAAINGTEYETISAALCAVRGNPQDGTVVKLLENDELSEIYNVDLGCDLTIDLNGKTLKFTPTGGGWLFHTETPGKTLTVKNGTFETANDNAYGIVHASAGTAVIDNVTCTALGRQSNIKASTQVDKTGSITLKNSTFNGTGRWSSAVYVAAKDASANVINCTVANPGVHSDSGAWYCHAAVRVSNGGSATINGGSYSGTKYVLYVLSTGGTITVEDGTFSGPVYLDGRQNAEGRLTVNGGDFRAVDSWGRQNETYNTFKLNYCLLGSELPPEAQYYTSDYECVKVSEGTYRVQIKDYDTYVARIGQNYYKTLGDAFGGLSAGCTVKMLKDVDQEGTGYFETDNVTFDLGGTTMTCSPTVNKYFMRPGEDGSQVRFTIKNGTFNCGQNCSGIAHVSKGAHLYLQNLTVNGAGVDFCVRASAGAMADIEECTFMGGNKAGVYASDATVNLQNVNVTVSTGTGYQSAALICTVNNSSCTMNVDGGSYAGPVYSLANGGCMNIRAGEFTGGYLTDGGTISITGGSFSANPSAYVAPGYAAVSSGGKYVVQAQGPAASVVKIGDKGYASVAAAVSDATAGATIVVQDDLSLEDTVVIGKAVTLDLNSWTVTTAASDKPAFRVTSGGSLTIVDTAENGLLTTAGGEAIVAEGGAVDIRSGVFNAPIAVGSGSLAISDGTFVLDVDADYIVTISAGVSASITGGSFYSPISSAVGKFISGGAFAEETIDGAYIADGYKLSDTAEDDLYPVIEKPVEDPVATIGGKGYATLQAALEALNANGGTLTLQKDCSMTSGIVLSHDGATIDLGGKTLTVKSSGSAAIAVGTGVKVTVKNGRVVGDTCLFLAEVSDVRGSLTLEGIVSGKDSDGTISVVNGVMYAHPGKIVAKNCTIKSAKTIFAVANGDGEVRVDGGTYVCTGTGTVYLATPFSSGGLITFENGTFTSAGTAIYVDHRNSGTAGATCTVCVKGGTITGAVGVSDSNTSQLYLEGGTYLNFSASKKTAAAILNISGGQYDQDPSAYVVSGKMAKKVGDLWEIRGIPTEVTVDTDATEGTVTIAVPAGATVKVNGVSKPVTSYELPIAAEDVSAASPAAVYEVTYNNETVKFGQMLVQPTGRMTIIPVVWEAFGGGSVRADDLIEKCDLVSGDRLHVYGKSGESYQTWRWDGSAWAPANTLKVAGGSAKLLGAGEPEAVTIPRGMGVWLEQETPKAVHLVGKCTSTEATFPALEAGWNLTGNSGTGDLDLDQATALQEVGTVIVPTEGAPVRYTKQNGKWGSFVEKETRITVGGKEITGKSSTWTEGAKIKAGKGFWAVK